ncbi:MAG: hypothetical protein GX823_01315 [Clostridiales bacterium]|nr:hypothetical protein [Clostridiales bacterium]
MTSSRCASTGIRHRATALRIAGGRAVFVHRALSGELLNARILKVTKTAVFAKIEELLEASPERTEPECPHFRRCGCVSSCT